MEGKSVLGDIFRQILTKAVLTAISSYFEVPEAGPPAPSSEELWRFSQSIFNRLDADREHFVLLVLDKTSAIIGSKVISTGTPTKCHVEPREVYGAALSPEWETEGIAFAHNHPSGDPEPSAADEGLTLRLKLTGDLLGIKVWDHIIMGDERYFSFADEGLL